MIDTIYLDLTGLGLEVIRLAVQESVYAHGNAYINGLEYRTMDRRSKRIPLVHNARVLGVLGKYFLLHPIHLCSPVPAARVPRAVFVDHELEEEQMEDDDEGSYGEPEEWGQSSPLVTVAVKGNH